MLSLFTGLFASCSDDDERDYPELPFQTETEGYDEREIARQFSLMHPSLEALEELWEYTKWSETVMGHVTSGINLRAALLSEKSRCPKFCDELETYLRSQGLTGTREELFEPFVALNAEIWWIISYKKWDHKTLPRYAYFFESDVSWGEPKELNGFDSDGNPVKIQRDEWTEGNVILIHFKLESIFYYINSPYNLI